jgi:hypothetical protein
LINLSLQSVLEKITSDNLIEKAKRPNSKYYIEEIKEYVLLVTAIPDCLIGSQVKLPGY